MPVSPTTKYLIPKMDPTALVKNGPADINTALDSIDSKFAGYSEGTLAARPTSTVGTPGIAGREYYTTDTAQRFKDTGTGWVEMRVASSRGKATIPGTDTRTNTAYGLMATPDRVQGIVLPAGGLIVVGYQALWQESVAGAARAAIFVGATQQMVQSAFSTPLTPGPQTVAAVTAGGTTATDRPLVTTPVGLVCLNTTSVAADVTTGQAIGVVAGTVGANVEVSAGGTTTLTLFSGINSILGGACYIFAAAGTYDISIQFKASSGSVTAKDRKLWVWTEAF